MTNGAGAMGGGASGQAGASGIRRGFTLIEVVVAITLTAIVLAIAAAALGAATSARARVEAHQRTTEAHARLRGLLIDMLRHAPSADAADEPMLRIARDGAGRPTLMFLSTGVHEPLGTGAPWRVTIALEDTSLVVEAIPLGSASADTPLHSVLSGVSFFDVQVLEPARPGERAQWRRDWPMLRTRPPLVELRFGGAGTLAQLVAVSLAPLEDFR